MRRWRKVGRIYVPAKEGQHPKLLSYAANPLPVHMEGDVYRVFFSGRDQCNRSSVGAVDIDIVKQRLVKEHTDPFFEHGPEGTFYSSGVSIGSSYEVNGARYILFMGWQTPRNGHWRGDIGRLLLTPDLNLRLSESEPLLGSDPTDPISLSYPWVMPREEGGYDMWYGSTVTWDAGNGEMLHVIQHASSMDGYKWQRNGLAIPYVPDLAQAYSRPTVIKSKARGYEMWFSYRGNRRSTYRIGYATSREGRRWSLKLDDSGIDVSGSGWDSDMIEYPFVFEHKNVRYMLYNGNGYGKTGFGLAILDDT